MPGPTREYTTNAERQRAYRQRSTEARRKEREAKGMPPLPVIASIPGDARWDALIGQASWLLQTCQDEMQSYYDQRSDRWQESERGESFLERLQALQEARSIVEDLG